MQKENKSDNHDPASDSPEQSYILPGICIGMILGMLLGFAMGSLVFHNIILGLVCWSLPWHCGRRCHSKTKIISRQHRTEFVRKMRSRIFRQIACKAVKRALCGVAFNPLRTPAVPPGCMGCGFGRNSPEQLPGLPALPARSSAAFSPADHPAPRQLPRWSAPAPGTAAFR